MALDHDLDADKGPCQMAVGLHPKESLEYSDPQCILAPDSYMEHNQTFRCHEGLLPNVEAERLAHMLALENLAKDDEAALVWRHLQTQEPG